MTCATNGNQDDIKMAVHGLNIFTKNWCMNCKETDEKHDLVFRCGECEFLAENDYCLIKRFAYDHEHDYSMENFGSMGQL